MLFRRKRTVAERRREARAPFVRIREYCQGRLDAGDIDLDDWVVWTRDECDAILSKMRDIELRAPMYITSGEDKKIDKINRHGVR